MMVSKLVHMISGLRFRLLLLVLLACVPLVGLTLHTASEARRRDQANWNQRLRRIQQLANVEEERLIKQTRQLLLALSEAASVQTVDEQGCQKLLNELFYSHPGFVNLGVLNTNGEVLASARAPDDITSPAGREFFRKTMDVRGFAMGEYRSDPLDGGPLLIVGYPAVNRRGQIQAVAFATLALDWSKLLATDFKSPLPRTATIKEIDARGSVLGGYPFREPAAPATGLAEALVAAATSKPQGTLAVQDSDGVLRWYAFASRRSQLLGGEVITILGIPEQALFAEADRLLRRNLSWLGVAVSLALVLGWVGSSLLIVRPVRALVAASGRLAAGDLTSRTGLRHGSDELGQLTRSFDQMAQALEQRERDRRLAQETLETRDHMIRELPLFPAAVCVCDQSGVVELYNRAAVDLWGCEPPDPHAGKRFCGSHLLFHPDGTLMPHSESPMAEVLRTGVPVQQRDLLIGRPDGSRVPVLANVVPLRDSDGGMIGAVSCLQDVSERKRNEERLQEAHEKLQHMSRRLVESQEIERRHIARELHDEVGQTLTVAEMNLQSAVQSSRASSIKGRLNESLQAVERVLEQVRDLSLNLRPSMLDDLGLEPALRWYCGRQAALAGLDYQFHADPMERRLDSLIETACFRVAQEALTNVVRHAGARSVSVDLRQEADRLSLRVRDDGAGFDVGALRQRAVLGGSLGLLSMEERAVLAGGGFECHSVPGEGSEVRAWFPLKWRATDS